MRMLSISITQAKATSGASMVIRTIFTILEIKKDIDFVQSLLENNGIAVVQGSAFGLEGFFRISYATSMENLKMALEKITSFCKSLK